MSKSRTIVAVNTLTLEAIAATSVTKMAEIINTSRTNISDLVNNRPGRSSVNGKGGNWVIA